MQTPSSRINFCLSENDRKHKKIYFDFVIMVEKTDFAKKTLDGNAVLYYNNSKFIERL